MPLDERLRIAHVIPHLDNEAAGPTQSVLRLCESLAQAGVRVDLHTMAAGRPPIGVNLVAYDQWAALGRFGFSYDLVTGLTAACRIVDVIHNHSLWSGSNIAAGLAMRRQRALLVTSPRGTLAPEALARSRFRKWLFKPLQWQAVTRAACLHATSHMEYEDIRRAGLRSPVAIIPNGIDVPTLTDDTQVPLSEHRMRLLFLGRLHPIKGIEMLLQSWQELQDRHQDWELLVVGEGAPAYVRSLHERARQLQLERVRFAGPAFGSEKRRLYLSSDLFVLPTKTENFGMAIAEALAHALPVITTRGAPWPGLVTHRCGWWVERSQSEMVAALDLAMGVERQVLESMGQRGRQWMLSDFDWRSIAGQTRAVYQWLLAGGGVPPWVMLD